MTESKFVTDLALARDEHSQVLDTDTDQARDDRWEVLEGEKKAEAVAQNQITTPAIDRLQKYFIDSADSEVVRRQQADRLTEKQAEQEEESKGPDLSTIHWDFFSDQIVSAVPTLEVQQAEAQKQYLSREERAKKLQEQADIYQDDPNYPHLRELINKVFTYDKNFGFNGSKKPEEISALIIILHDSGIGTLDNPGNEKFAQALFDGVVAVRTFSENKGWQSAGLDGNLLWGSNHVNKLISEARVRGGVSQQEFDGYVMGALACADVMTALQLIQSARQIIKDQPEAMNSALSRLAGDYQGIKNTFQVAFDLYPESQRTQMNLVLSSIGKGALEALGENAIARKLQYEAEKQVKAETLAERNDWYRAQQVANVSAKILEANGRVETEINRQVGREKGSVGEIITRQREAERAIVLGRVANSIAAELIRRLHPEMSVDARIAERQTVAQRMGAGRVPFTGYPRSSADFNAVYGNDYLSQGLSTEVMKSRMFSIGVQSVDLARLVGSPKESQTNHLRALIALLRYPGAFAALFDEKLNRDFKNGESNFSHKGKFQEGKMALAQSLMSGLEFLQTIAEQPFLREVLVSMFGFEQEMISNLLDPHEGPRQALLKTFNETPIDPRSDNAVVMPRSELKKSNEDPPLTIGELQAAKIIDLGQTQIDAKQARQLGEIAQAELNTLTAKAREKIANRLTEIHAEAHQVFIELDRAYEKLKVPRRELKQAEDEVALLEETIRKTEEAEIIRWEWLPNLSRDQDKLRLTKDQQTLQLTQLNQLLDGARQRITAANSSIAEIGVVDENAVEAARIRHLRLRFLLTDLKQ